MSDEIKNFIEEIIDDENASGKHGGVVSTRFPPEPNGYLHIGHAKSICLNFGLAKKYGGSCNLRFDDTNPETEDVEYVDSIQDDVKWLGFEWDALYFASDYYQAIYDCAVGLIRKGIAYVEELSFEQIKEYRGNYNITGRPSPFRERPLEENLRLFEKMRKGESPDGSLTLRAKIDLAAGNMNMRDPVLYRIRHVPHHRTGTTWCLYPMYDYAHPISDALEGITHSICTLEFEDHRPLYDWVIRNCDIPAPKNGTKGPRQIEFARLSLTHTLMSKRLLIKLVQEKLVEGWDDPRMPTIAGIRRRGFTPASLRNFADRIGVAKANSTVDVNLLFHSIREELNIEAPRAMAVLNPLKVVITNYPENQEEELDADNNPEKPETGKRKVSFCREIYIERDDFLEVPSKKFFRLAPGKEVRLKHAYYIICNEVIKDATGNIVELHCSYDPESRGGWSPDARNVKGTLQWVSVRHGVTAKVRLYEHLFLSENPANELSEKEMKDCINADSLIIMDNAKVEPSLAQAEPGTRFQFLRNGYFCADIKEHQLSSPVFNRIVGLKDSWAKEKNK